MSAAGLAVRAPGQPDPAPVLPAAHAPAQARADAPEPTTGRPFLIVDGTGLLVRCRQAAVTVPLSTADGVPTGALMMFISSLARQVRLRDPGHVLVCWDGPDALSWRRGVWPGYKASRLPAPALGSPGAVHGELAMEFCSAAGIAQDCVRGFEADDIIASAARSAWDTMPGRPVLICSDDADLHQLTVWDGVSVCGLAGDEVLDRAAVERAWGVSVWDLAKLRALAGDRSDGIPGLPGVGRARARRLLERNGWRWPLGECLIPDAKDREMVVKWRDIMELVFPLHTPEGTVGADYFQVDVPCRWAPEPAGQLLSFLRGYEMTSLADRLERGGLWQ